MTKFERSLTSRILSKLIKAELIERTNSADDARMFSLKATLKGEALCDQADPLTIELEQLILSPLTDKEREAFLAMVGRVRAWVQEGYVRKVASQYPEMGKRRTRMRKSMG